MRRSNPRRTQKRTSGDCGEAKKSTDTNYNTRNKLHKAQFSGVRSLDAGQKIVVIKSPENGKMTALAVHARQENAGKRQN
jgi:hypothetical protein